MLEQGRRHLSCAVLGALCLSLRESDSPFTLFTNLARSVLLPLWITAPPSPQEGERWKKAPKGRQQEEERKKKEKGRQTHSQKDVRTEKRKRK